MPCKVLDEYLESEGLTVTRIDVDEDFDTSLKYDVRGVPTLIKTEDGKELDRIIGFNNSIKDKVRGLFV